MLAGSQTERSIVSSLLVDAVTLSSFYHSQKPSPIVARKCINWEMDRMKLLAFALVETQQVSQSLGFVGEQRRIQTSNQLIKSSETRRVTGCPRAGFSIICVMLKPQFVSDGVTLYHWVLKSLSLKRRQNTELKHVAK